MAKKKIIEHKITTIEDIFKVVDKENFSRFMMDFVLFISQVGDLKEKHPDIKVQAMLWKDDGINEMTGYSINNGDRVIFKKNKS